MPDGEDNDGDAVGDGNDDDNDDDHDDGEDGHDDNHNDSVLPSDKVLHQEAGETTPSSRLRKKSLSISVGKTSMNRDSRINPWSMSIVHW